MLNRTLLLKMADCPRMEKLVRHSRLAAPLVKRFVAGETIGSAEDAIRAFQKRGISVALDLLGENARSHAESDAAVESYRRLLNHLPGCGYNVYLSVKLTQIGLDLSDDVAEHALRSIVEECAAHDIFVRIDMEGSAYTQRTVDLFGRVRNDFENVGIVLQAYLYRTEADIYAMNERHAQVRLVKGAYMEPASIAFPRKGDVDGNYVKLMKDLLVNGTRPAIATHDEAIIGQVIEFARARNITPHQFEFQMLYGVRRDLQNRLAAEGYHVRVYVPFGTQWYGYFMRRLAERPANTWFVLSNIFRE